MSEVSVLRVDGSGARGYTHHSEKKQWTVTVGQVTSKFDYLLINKTAQPDVQTWIALNRVVNSGTRSGNINVVAAELNSDGSVIRECRKSITLATKEYCGLNATFRYDTVFVCKITKISSDSHRAVDILKHAGIYYFGIKTWGEDESEPEWETFSALEEKAITPTYTPTYTYPTYPETPEKWCIPGTSICLEPWQWGVVVAAGLLTAGGTYAIVRSARGKQIL